MSDENEVPYLTERLGKVIKDARISPRIVASVTSIHWTTIYAVLKGRDSNPLTTKVLNEFVDKVEKLVNEGKVPFTETLPHTERAERLKTLIS